MTMIKGPVFGWTKFVRSIWIVTRFDMSSEIGRTAMSTFISALAGHFNEDTRGDESREYAQKPQLLGLEE